RSAVPALLRAARIEVLDRTEPVGTLDTAAATDPRLVIPVQVAAIGAALNFWVVFFARPVPPYTANVAALWAILGAAALLLWLRQTRRHATGVRRPNFLVRAGKTTGALVVVIAA